MSGSLHDLQRRLAAQEPPPFDVAAIVDRGNVRRRRRHAGLALGAAALVVGVVVAGTTLTGHQRRSSGPVTPPTPSVTEPPAPSPARPLTYTDDFRGRPTPWRIRSIQYGDRTLRPGLNVLHTDLTDDGLGLLAENGGVYFTDGSSVERIGSVTIQVDWSDVDVKSGADGSLLAWFSPARPTSHLVVYDTQDHAVVARKVIAGCGNDECWVSAVVGDRVYVDPKPDTSDSPTRPLLALDVTSGSVVDTDPRGLAEDMRRRPRGLVVGGSFARGEVVNSEAAFEPQDGSLVLRRFVRETADGEGVFIRGGFDTTGRRLHLRLPRGYRPAEVGYSLFQWLDDDRFAVMAGAVHNEFGWNGFRGYGDVLVCSIPRERCTLAAKGPAKGYRLVPHLDVPN